MKEYIITEIMTYDYQHQERFGRMILQRWSFEVKMTLVDSRMNKYNPRNPTVEMRVAEIVAHYVERAKELDVTFATGSNSSPFVSSNRSKGKCGIEIACG